MRGVPKSGLGSIQIAEQHAFHSASAKLPSSDFGKLFKNAAEPDSAEKTSNGLMPQGSPKRGALQEFQPIPAEHGEEKSPMAELKDTPDAKEAPEPSADSKSISERQGPIEERLPKPANVAAQTAVLPPPQAKATKNIAPGDARFTETRKEHKTSKAGTAIGHGQRSKLGAPITNKEEVAGQAAAIPQSVHVDVPVDPPAYEKVKSGKEPTPSPGSTAVTSAMEASTGATRVAGSERANAVDAKQTSDHENASAPAVTREHGQNDSAASLDRAMQGVSTANQLPLNPPTISVDMGEKSMASMQSASQSPSHWGDRMVAGESHGVGGSASISPGDSAQMHQVLKAGPKQLEVGVMDGTHGWLQIRAESGSSGSINASLTGGARTHEPLRQAVPEMAAYLASEQIKVGSISIHRGSEMGASSEQRMAGNNAGAGQGREEGPSSRWGGDLQGDARHRQRGETDQASGIQASRTYKANAEGDLISRVRDEASNLKKPYGAGSGFSGPGSWLNVIA